EAADVHPRVRPRYARILGTMSYALRRVRPDDALAAARAAAAFLPTDPRKHYELGDASFVIGLHSFPLAEALFLLARHELDAGGVDSAKRHLRLYLVVLPRGREPRLTEAEIEDLGPQSELD
ncbi:MAG: hypothetical protein ACE5JG_06990, partial [Planctomycetota bacterium]